MSLNPASPEPLLDIADLTVRYGPAVTAVKGVNLAIGRERVAIVGESGSGKSTIGRAIMRILPPFARITAERLRFEGQDLLTLNGRQMQAIRGRRISMILQDPRYSLHPITSIGEQIAEAYRVHRPHAGRAECRAKVLDMLASVRITDPERVYGLYRHQVSGGMGQRIVMAMMLIQEPVFLIADEPTSALDVVVRQRVLEILDELVRERGLGLIFISHDLNLVRTFCDRVVVMYRGQIVDTFAVDAIETDRHPYTRALLDALPDAKRRDVRLPVIPQNPEWAPT